MNGAAMSGAQSPSRRAAENPALRGGVVRSAELGDAFHFGACR
jgi:hypothetical protein